MQNKQFKVLVAEDELFQRLALLDFMDLCEFHAGGAKNGQEALNELRKPDANFDCVLLDLVMPELNGFQVLQQMKEDDRLKEIPVVVMSANESQEVVGQCLQQGATDYLVKPVRHQQCRALQNKMRRSGSTHEETSKLQGIEKYERIRPVGSGAAGIVSLYKSRIDGKEYALKEIDLSSLSTQDKKSARDEVQFLRVLRGPTIVKFYESFNHESSIFIVMEYASRGNLEQAI